MIGIENSEQICVEALNGKQALDILKDDLNANYGEFSCFDLILMDFCMPVMDGNEASLKIRELFLSEQVKQPIICGLTGHVEEKFVQKAFENGMNQVFSKPI